MPAIIRVSSGPGGGREHWIERPVIRVGSDPDSDLCLPDPAIPSHAATIEFRNKQYVVHNRSEQTFLLGGRSIEKQSKSTWENEEKLEFPGVVVLELFLDRDPSPTPKPHLPEPEPPVTDSAEVRDVPPIDAVAKTKTGFSPKEMVQLAVTICCVLGMIVIIAFKVMPQNRSEKRVIDVKFGEVLEDRKNVSEPYYLSMVDEVQEAMVLKSRGDKSLANEKLRKIRSQLHDRRDGEGKLSKPHEERLYAFVVSQVSEE
jgi:hypothetical protein